MISVILIDSELTTLKKLKNSLIKYADINICGMYTSLIESINEIEIKKPDAIFLGVENYYMGELDIEVQIQNINMNTEIIFFAENEAFAVKAFEIGALDYILKPITNDRLKKSIIRLRKRHNIKAENNINKPMLQLQCFGNYHLTKNEINTESIKWRTNKVKELFAYLILKNGKEVHKSELIEVLFEGVDQKKAQNSLYVTMSYLRKQLEEFGIDRNSILVKGNYTLHIGKGVCDFVDFDRFLNKYSNEKIDAENIIEYEKIINLYKGAYLQKEDYLWAYDVREYIYNKYEEILLSMVEYYKNNRNLRKAEKILLNIISNNSLSEEGNKGLLELYMKLKKTKLYLKQYERYTTLLREELNIIPEKKYSDYCDKIYKEN
jgi:two-component SAPR family response regulator